MNRKIEKYIKLAGVYLIHHGCFFFYIHFEVGNPPPPLMWENPLMRSKVVNWQHRSWPDTFVVQFVCFDWECLVCECSEQPEILAHLWVHNTATCL